MRILVTGAAGFVGRNLTARLAPEHSVVGIDQTAPSGAIDGVCGDIGDAETLATALRDGCDAVVHLATVPGGAAELEPALAKRINVDATMALIDACATAGRCPRFVFASSIAVFGDPLPPHVDDTTPIAPRLLYGTHKAMMEQWIATQSRRGAIDGLSLRLPGIIARPSGPSGMKSAFMSDVFHAARGGKPIVLPVSPHATMWLMSVDKVVENFIHALGLRGENRPLTLPALRVTMADLVAEILCQTGAEASLITYRPEPLLEAAFGAQPPLATPLAEQRGFRHDGSLTAMVASALSTLETKGTLP